MNTKLLTSNQKKAMLNFQARLKEKNSRLSKADWAIRKQAIGEIYGPRSVDAADLKIETQEIETEIDLFKRNLYIFKQLKEAGLKIKLDKGVAGFYNELKLHTLARSMKQIYLTLSDIQSTLFTSVVVAKDYDYNHPDIVIKQNDQFINWLTFITNSTNIQLKEMNAQYKAEQQRLFTPYVDFLKKQNIRATYSLANNQLLSFAFENLFMALEKCGNKIIKSLSSVHISDDQTHGKIYYNPTYNSLELTPNIWADDIYKYLDNFFNPTPEIKPQATTTEKTNTEEPKHEPRIAAEKISILRHIEQCLNNKITDPYKFFDVSKEERLETIKSKYRQWAMFFHPDKNKNDLVAKEMFLKIHTMYKEIELEKNKR